MEPSWAILDALTSRGPALPNPGEGVRGRGTPLPEGEEGVLEKRKRAKPPTPRGLVGLARCVFSRLSAVRSSTYCTSLHLTPTSSHLLRPSHSPQSSLILPLQLLSCRILPRSSEFCHLLPRPHDFPSNLFMRFPICFHLVGWGEPTLLHPLQLTDYLQRLFHSSS